MSDPSTLEATIERLISDRLADYGLNLADKPALAKTLDPPLLSKLLKEFPDLTSSTEVGEVFRILLGKDFSDFIPINYQLPAKDRETLLQWISGIQELRLISDDFIPVLSRILHNFGDGVLFLNLERLECHMRYIPPPRSKFCPLFLLPHTLQHVDLHINPCAYAEDEGISDQLQLLAKMIKSLPPSLKSLSVTCCQGQSGLLQDAMNSLIHRCRSSLTSFETTRGPPVEQVVYSILPHGLL